MDAPPPTDPAVLSSPRCPHCGRRFSRVRWSEQPIQRRCACGRRWQIDFQRVEHDFAARLGVEAWRAHVAPWSDGRRRAARADVNQLAFEFPEPLEVGPARRRPRP